MIRLFAALSLPDEIAQMLAPLQRGVDGARWRPREALHLTLRFFGDIPEPAADAVDAELQEIAGEPFELQLSGVGCFGEGRSLHAIWAGVADSEPLRRLAGRCESAARRAGLKPETRNFLPHVTLAYLRGADEAAVAQWVADHNLLKTPPFLVDAFHLFSSWNGRSGSVYREERTYPLS